MYRAFGAIDSSCFSLFQGAFVYTLNDILIAIFTVVHVEAIIVDTVYKTAMLMDSKHILPTPCNSG